MGRTATAPRVGRYGTAGVTDNVTDLILNLFSNFDLTGWWVTELRRTSITQMRPVFFKVTLWNDPQKGAKRPAEWGACRAANRYLVLPSSLSLSLACPCGCMRGPQGRMGDGPWHLGTQFRGIFINRSHPKLTGFCKGALAQSITWIFQKCTRAVGERAPPPPTSHLDRRTALSRIITHL